MADIYTQWWKWPKFTGGTLGGGGVIMVILDDLSEVAYLIIYNNIKLISYFL